MVCGPGGSRESTMVNAPAARAKAPAAPRTSIFDLAFCSKGCKPDSGALATVVIQSRRPAVYTLHMCTQVF